MGWYGFVKDSTAIMESQVKALLPPPAGYGYNRNCMAASRPIEWFLRLFVFVAFASHSAFVLQTRPAWTNWFSHLMGLSADQAASFVFLMLVLEFSLALMVLILPIRLACLTAALWAVLALAVRPIPFAGQPLPLEFLEHAAYWGMPLLLLALRGWPRTWRELLT